MLILLYLSSLPSMFSLPLIVANQASPVAVRVESLVVVVGHHQVGTGAVPLNFSLPRSEQIQHHQILPWIHPHGVKP